MKIKKIQVPYQPDYDEPTEVPYKSEYSIPVTSKKLPSSEDVKHLEKLVKEGREEEAENFINRAVLSREIETSLPGLPTRNYVARALHKSILNRHPFLNDYTLGGQAEYLPDIVYPGLDDLKEKLKLSNKIIPSLKSSYAPIDSKIPHREAGSIKLDITSNSYLDDILHENAHAIDDILKNAKKGKWKKESSELRAIEDFVKNNPKFKKLYESPVKRTTEQEGTPLSYFKLKYSPIRRLPNFEDYDPRTGEFGSDIIESPIDKYKEVGGEHHIERPFSLENFINFAKGGLKDIVKNYDKFSKLRKTLV